MAKVDDVTPDVEDPHEQQVNLRAEADIARLLGSVRKLSRQRRETLDAPTGVPQREALDALAGLYADGRLGAERYLYVMNAVKGAPVGASHAALAIMVRDNLTPRHYDALTAAARAVSASLPT